MTTPAVDNIIHTRPIEILQQLLRLNTTNPPGNEVIAIDYLEHLLNGAGIETTRLARDPQRPNLIARLKGRGEAPPVLMQGHVDVVTTANQKWTHDPFAGVVEDGFIWGRGALDMKGGVAMMVAAFLRAYAEHTALPGDVVLCLLSDEEAGGNDGAKFLVEQHPEQFEGIRYGIGEFGGFTMVIGGKRFYPIMVAEKQICWTRVVFHGPAGHGSMPQPDGAMARMARFLTRIDRQRLPVHVTPVVRQMLNALARELPFPMGTLLGQMANPAFTNGIINLIGAAGKTFDPIMHNTVAPTIIHASDKINVVPAEIALQLDGRLLPGQTPDDLFRELRPLLDENATLELVQYDPGPPDPNMTQFDMLAGVLREADPTGAALPLLLPGVTDARFFARLGIQTYGFLPMQLPPDFNFRATIHAADERLPVEAVDFGARAIHSALQRFTD